MDNGTKRHPIGPSQGNARASIQFRQISPTELVSDEEVLQAFKAFEDRLYAANEVMNLTRVPKIDSMVRHFLDSLLIMDLIPEGASVLDIGTGPGFPAWPLARARPDLQVTAMDSSSKMLGFLRANSLPNLRVVNRRAELVEEPEHYDVVTGRAVAPLAVQMEISAAYAKIGGYVIPMRTDKELGEIERFPAERLGLKLEGIKGLELAVSDAKRVFPLFRKVRPTPTRYPRSWTEIRRSPL